MSVTGAAPSQTPILPAVAVAVRQHFRKLPSLTGPGNLFKLFQTPGRYQGYVGIPWAKLRTDRAQTVTQSKRRRRYLVHQAVRRLLLSLTVWGACWWALEAAPCAAQSAEPDTGVIYTRRTLFAIPFQIERPSAAAQEPSEVELFVSSDFGASWQPHATAKPAQRNFAFRAPGDGEFWFAVQSTDAQGRRRPSEIHQPELRVIVDSSAPKLEISAQQGSAGEVICQWTIRDAAIDPSAFKLEHQSGGPASLWRPVAVEPLARPAPDGAISGQTTWWPQSPVDDVVLRCEVSDRAGNRALEQFRVERSVMAGRSDLEKYWKSTADADPNGARRWPADAQADSPFRSSSSGEEIPAPPPRGGAKTSPAAQRSERELPAAEEVVPPVGAKGAAAPAAAGPDVASNFPASEDLPAPSSVAPGFPPDGGPPPLNSPFNAGDASLDAAVATDTAPPLEAPALPDAAPHRTRVTRPSSPRRDYTEKQGLFDLSLVPRGQRPEMIHSRRFELDYEVADVGSSGIGRVELWGTRDGGRTWESYAIDEDQQSPIDVTVHGEGIYGFRIAVRSGAGVGGQGPASGELPDVWMGVDVTRPFARLLAAEQGAGQDASQVIVRWEAADELLGERPIALAFSAAAGGPWTTIADQLENTGEYAWKLDAGVPEQFFLRLTVRDEAGNEQTVESREPVTLDRQRPTGHIRQIRPSARDN